MTARYANPWNEFQFCGTAGEYDLYLCETTTGKSLLARFGNDPGDYASYPDFVLDNLFKPGYRISLEGGRSMEFLEWIKTKEAPEYYRAWKEIMDKRQREGGR